MVEDLHLVDPLDARQGERGAGPVPEQPFQTRAVLTLDTLGRVSGGFAVVRPGAPVLGVVRVEEAASHEPAQDGAATGGRHSGDRRLIHGLSFEDGDGGIILCPCKDAVDDADGKMGGLVAGGAEGWMKATAPIGAARPLCSELSLVLVKS